HALALAAAFESEVLLQRVMPAPSAPVNSVDWRLRKLEIERYLEEVAGRLKIASATRLVNTGNAAEQILAAVETHGVDLLVLCRHGEGGTTEFHLSGTASKLVGSASCSILLVSPSTAAPAVREPAVYGKVLIPVDCSKRAEWAVCLAAALARAAGAEVVLAHVVPPPELVEPATGDPAAVQLARDLRQANRAAARGYLETLVSRIQTRGLQVRYRISEDEHVGPMLLRIAQEEGASVVVLSAHGHAPALGVSYGSIASALIANAAAPVLIFQDTPPARGHARGPARSAAEPATGAGR
ncbi:MAG TPA: universal stress protein, partial [Longimicrobium sp.]|nr:universal stress protein [Longimicrobium sp.]